MKLGGLLEQSRAQCLLAWTEERDCMTTGTNPDILPQAEFLSYAGEFYSTKMWCMQNTICALSYTDLSNKISQKMMHNLSVVLGLEKNLKMHRV